MFTFIIPASSNFTDKTPFINNTNLNHVSIVGMVFPKRQQIQMPIKVGGTYQTPSP
jgi:hypothetical protein